MEVVLINMLRGIAFIFMFIYHIFVFLKVMTKYDYLNNYYLNLIGIISRNIFIILVGISLYLSYINSNDFTTYKKKQILRSIKIYIIAMFVTLFTYYTIYEYYVVFGVLHFISISIFILHNFINNFKILFMILFICLYLNYNNFNLYSTNSFINYIYNIVGFNIYKNTIDSFPLIKWIPKIILGIFIGYFINYFYLKYNKTNKKIKKSYNDNSNNFINFIGKNTLILYLIHLPVIYLLIRIIMLYIN
tara:strand:+ start:203 stop:943 length:741 start_codon:yes stop_codon:yes gene_type:complete